MILSLIRMLLIIYVLLTIVNPVFCQIDEILNVDVEIRTEKRMYLTHEPILVSIKLVNNSTENLYISTSRLRTNLSIMDSRNQALRPVISSSEYKVDPIKPGEVLKTRVNIALTYGADYQNNYGDTEFIPPETYQVQLVWKSPKLEGGQLIGYVQIVSNTLEIIVQDPTGDEKVAVELLREACKLKLDNKRDLSTDKFIELIERFPQSVYASKVLKKAIQNHKFQKTTRDREKAIRLSKRLVENYPHENYAYSSLDFIIKHYKAKKDREGARQYLIYLEKKIKDIQFEKVISDHLQKIK